LQESVSDPVDLGDNHMVLIKLREHLPAAVRPLEEVRGEIEQELRQQRAQEAARADAQAFLDELTGQEGVTVAELAGRDAREVQQVEAATRDSQEPDPVLVTEVFRMARPQGGQPSRALLQWTDGFAVVALEQVMDGELEPGAALARQQYRRRVAGAAAAAEAMGMLKQLRAAAEVEIFEDRLR